MILSGAAVIYQLVIIDQMQETTSGLKDVSFRAASQLLDMERDADLIYGLTAKFLTVGDAFRPDYERYVDDAIRTFDERFKLLLNILGPTEAKNEIVLLWSSWAEYKSLVEKWRLIPNERGREEMPLEMKTAVDLLKSRTRSSYTGVVKSIQLKVGENERMGMKAQSLAYPAAAVFLLSGALITFLTVRAINRPLRELTQGTRKIASGEFTHRLPVKGPSEFKELAKDFNAMTEKLGELDQMKKEFVAHVSHELKAPLAAIRQTLAVTLEQVPGPINEGQRRLLDLSRNSAERLSAMVSNLLDVSRLEAGTMEYEMRPSNIINIVNQTVEEFSLKASERNIDIRVESAASNIPVVCDADRMIQVVGNLIDNALKFSPENSTIRVAVGHNDAAAVPTVRVAIADRGSGVPDAHKENVFLKFHQLNGGGKRTAGQGVGLGLAICKTIIDAHRGRIWVEDNPEGGSVFCVEMRAAPVKETAPAAGSVR
jgi:two-component system sensor histidine kinase GlrK